MTKRPKKYEDKMFIDMPFGEALTRFVGVKPDEMHANIAKTKKKKPPGRHTRGDKTRALPGGHGHDHKVVKLRDHRNKRSSD